MAIPGLEVTERPWAGSADARAFAQDPGPGNPNVPPGGSKQARSLRSATPVAAESTAAVAAPGRLRAAYDGFTGRNFVGPSPQLSAGTRAARMLGPAVAVATEAPGIARVAQDPNSSGIDVATQVAGASGKLAAAGLGAKAGAALGSLAGPIGTAAGGIIGGAAGYFGADSAIKAGRSAVGTEVADPAERVATTPTPAPSTPSLRARPEDAFAGPPALAAPTAADASAGVRRIDRPGQSPLFTNMPDGGLLGNDKLMGRGAISPQNMAAANNLAATDSLRSQGAAMGGPSTGTGIPAMAPAQHSGNSWEARNNLRNLEVGASSITNTPQWSRGSVSTAFGKVVNGQADQEGKVAAYLNARAADTAARTGSDAGSVARTNAQASMFGSKMSADASRYGSDNSLRGTMYSSDATLGAKRMEMERSLRQQQVLGELWKASDGKPEVFQRLAMQYGMPDAAKIGGDMAQSDQTRAQGAATSARKRLEGMAVVRNEKGEDVVSEGRVANLERTLTKMAPGWQHMSEPEQAALYGKAEASVNLLEGLNDRRNNSFWQSVGVDGKSASLDNLPDMKGGRLKTVKLLEGAMTGGGVSRGDYVLEVGGHKLYLPRDKVNQGELELLKARGVDISGMQK